MNRDDRTVRTVGERGEVQAISGKAFAEDEAMKEKLNAVFRLRLLYNSGEELWKHIGKSGSGNNSFGRVGGKDAFLRRAVFHELEREWFDEMGIELGWLLESYVLAAGLMEKYRILLEGEMRAGTYRGCCEQIVNVCVFGDAVSDEYSAKKQELLHQLMEEDVCCLTVFLLMLLGVFPPSVESRQGDAVGMKEVYEQVYDFFLSVCHRNILFVQTPRMTLFHKSLKDAEVKQTRIRLVKLAADVLSNLSVLASPELVAETVRRGQWTQLFPDLEGYWLGEHHCEQRPDYWRVEEIATGYVFYHYFQNENEKGKLHQQDFSINFYRNEEDYAYVQHPRSILQWLSNDKLSKDDVTYPHFVFGGGEKPTKIAFDSFMMDVSWFRPMRLIRAKDGWTPPTEKGMEVINDFEAYSYTFYLGLEAITPDFISVKDENGKSYRVSVSEHEELRNCTLNDAVGIITWADKRYIAFDHLMLYLPIEE